MSESTTNWVKDVEEAYSEGASDAEVCAIMKITQEEFQNNCATSPQFKRFVDIGNMLSKAWWLRQGRANLTIKAFNGSLWAFNMKNRHGWAEKTESTDFSADLNNKTTEQLRSEFQQTIDQWAGIDTSGASMRKAVKDSAH